MHDLPPSEYFPPAEQADSDGLVGFGGELSVDWLLDAYQHGIFPWPIFEEDEPMAWWSLDPRAILEFEHLHVSRRLARTIQSERFKVSLNRDFRGVLRGCATAAGRRGGTWLTDAMATAYTRLHELGYAHSVEAWRDGELAGGVYGVAIGGLFAAESMFYYDRDASKVALVALLEHLRARGYVLFDIQQLTDHTERMGAIEIPRAEYLRRLASAIDLPVTMGEQLETIRSRRMD